MRDCQENLILSQVTNSHLSNMEHCAWVYILMNKHNTTLYVGVTNNLTAGLLEHLTKQNRGSFSAKYNLDKLVYYEGWDSIIKAIDREKYIKGKSRAWRIQLIESMNPQMLDLSKEWICLNEP